jgi:hypothetical protein
MMPDIRITNFDGNTDDPLVGLTAHLELSDQLLRPILLVAWLHDGQGVDTDQPVFLLPGEYEEIDD